jgi:hypothetical protein
MKDECMGSSKVPVNKTPRGSCNYAVREESAHTVLEVAVLTLNFEAIASSCSPR